MKLNLLKREILNFINDIVPDERKMKKKYFFSFHKTDHFIHKYEIYLLFTCSI